MRYCYLAALQVGRYSPSALLHLGIAGDGSATEHNCDELGEAMNDFQHERFIRRVNVACIVAAASLTSP